MQATVHKSTTRHNPTGHIEDQPGRLENPSSLVDNVGIGASLSDNTNSGLQKSVKKKQLIIIVKEGGNIPQPMQHRNKADFRLAWSTLRPSSSEAELIASVRQRISDFMGFNLKHPTSDSILTGYDGLLSQTSQKSVGSKIS